MILARYPVIERIIVALYLPVYFAGYRSCLHDRDLSLTILDVPLFDGDGSYCIHETGYNRMIRVFDVAEPGRSFEARPTCKTRKSPVGQRGIISSLAFSPDPCGGGLFAAGSYAKTICLYSGNRCASDRILRPSLCLRLYTALLLLVICWLYLATHIHKVMV